MYMKFSNDIFVGNYDLVYHKSGRKLVKQLIIF